MQPITCLLIDGLYFTNKKMKNKCCNVYFLNFFLFTFVNSNFETKIALLIN